MKICWRKIVISFSVCLLAAFILFLWMRFVEPNLLKLEEISFQSDAFGGKNLKVIQLSDFHSKKFGEKEKKVLEVIKKTNPDFVFLTGDIIDWQTENFNDCFSFWQELTKDRKGTVFGVFGNHEHRNKNFSLVASLMKEAGIEILTNEARKIIWDNSSFYLIGVDDPHLGFSNLDKALSIVSEGDLRILLAHSPEIFRQAKYKDIFLTLVGHTHGCQINLPFLCQYIVSLNYDKQYRSGLYLEGGAYLYVNRGVGETFLPLRFNSLPEATLITINPE